jgi:hypothetical protein
MPTTQARIEIAQPRKLPPPNSDFYQLVEALSQQREQFGKPIASFQMVQDLIAKMLGKPTDRQPITAAA